MDQYLFRRILKSKCFPNGEIVVRQKHNSKRQSLQARLRGVGSTARLCQPGSAEKENAPAAPEYCSRLPKIANVTVGCINWFFVIKQIGREGNVK